MDPLLVFLRIPHIVFGVLLVGSILFLTLFLEPRLRPLGPAIQNPVMGALMPILTPVQLGSYIITLVTGIIITLIMRGNTLSTYPKAVYAYLMSLEPIRSQVPPPGKTDLPPEIREGLPREALP